MYTKLVIKDGIPYDILYTFSSSIFKNKNGEINKKILGEFVTEGIFTIPYNMTYSLCQ